MSNYVGTRAPRLDSVKKVTGRAQYAVDTSLTGMLHGAALRSPHAHARIVSIDTSKAEAAPGVEAIVTGREFPFLHGLQIRDHPFLAIDRVRYAGEPVVAVAATSEALAQQALDLIEVEYEELPVVADMNEALAEDAPLIHPDMEDYRRGGHEIIPHSNVNTLHTFERGDVEAAFAEADYVFEGEYTAHALSHAAMEVHAATARYDIGADSYELWVSTDRPFQVRAQIAKGLDIDTTQVRLHVTAVGGSFGGKSIPIAEAIAMALARHTQGRAVHVELSREEDLIASQTRVPAKMRIKTGVNSDGIMTARSAEVLWDSGAYATYTVGVAIRGSQTIFGPYRIPHVKLLSRQVYTNKEPSGAYRGYGTTQVTWACESHMDEIAAELGIDPVEFRLKNAFEEGDPWINGQILHSVAAKETIEGAAEAIDWGLPSEESEPHLKRGKGIATMIKLTLTPSSSNCTINVESDGRVQVVCGAPEIGSGQDTVLAQMAADAIGVPLSTVSMAPVDTSLTPYNGPVASSRTTYHMGNAILMAGEEIKERILGLAGAVFDLDPDELVLRDGFVLNLDGDRLIDLKGLLGKYSKEVYSISASSRYSSAGSPLLKADPGAESLSSIFWMFCTQAAEVEVDVETGVIRVLRVGAAVDVGKAINPMTVEQQIEGGVVMGISNGIFEEFMIDEGRIENGTFADYKLATIEDTPEIIPVIAESTHIEAPFGAKGVGEPAAATTPPAIANAIYNAVGVRIRDLPVTPAKVLEALADEV